MGNDKINKSRAALLVMDYQTDILALVPDQAESLLERTRALIETARVEKIPVFYVAVQFRPGAPEVSPRNKSFNALKKTPRLVQGTSGADIHPALGRLEGESLIVKHRVGAFFETEMSTLLRAQGVEEIFLAGISTSGVVLSTLRHAADADYKINVIADACADHDEEVHRVLMAKVFPRQAEILDTKQTLALFKS